MKIKIIELFKNIRKNLINFISITLFIFFGVSLFLGLDFAAHGIKSTLDDTFTNANMYDLKLKFYGLVDTSDINDLCNIDGVDEVEGFFATFDDFQFNDKKHTAYISSLTSDIAKTTIINGKLPSNDNEIIVNEKCAEELGISIGDTITFSRNNFIGIVQVFSRDYEGKDFFLEMQKDPCNFVNPTFTVSGTFMNPEYANHLTSHPIDPESSADVNAVFIVNYSAFNPSITGNKYNGVFIKDNDLKKYKYFDEEYLNGSIKLRENVEKYLDSNNFYSLDYNAWIEEYKATSGINSVILDLAFGFMGIDSESAVKLTDAESTVRSTIKDELASVKMSNNISGIFYNNRYAIGGVFFVIAILICYSVITRLVNDEAILIGTKKALGFRKKELISTYLAFSLISSGIGIVLGIAVAMVLEKIMVPVVLISNYSVDINTSYFGIELVLIITAITFILITAITYLGSSSIIKKNALKLLQGNVDNENKKQFSNKKSVSKAKLSLFYKTIIRNFKQDGKRIFATVIGISSSIALITASFSLKITMQKSFDIHFNEYIKYDSIVFIDSNVENAYDNLVEHFEEQNIKYTPVYKEFVTYHIDDSDAIIGDMFVYYNDDSFNELVTVQPSKKSSSFNNKGFWFPESYQKDFKCKDDALISLVDSKGNVTDFNSTGFYKYYNYYSATFVDYDTYSKTFDNQVEPNAFLINRNGEEINAFIEQMKTVKGHLYTFDSYGKTVKDMSVFNLVTTILFALYALATLLLAIFVILNLFVTHVKEKKRELIVLMINGYSKKDVAKYIYLDIILLTLISIVVGSLLGALLSWFGQVSIESTTMYLLHETDILSIALGNVIGIALVVIMTLISLKEIGKFKLKDINNN